MVDLGGLIIGLAAAFYFWSTAARLGYLALSNRRCNRAIAAFGKVWRSSSASRSGRLWWPKWRLVWCRRSSSAEARG